ncbi:MAG: DUF4411 family protein [Candidatus Marsarchaeota archaeon]|nr:DUF4411 family protein [Candidatus Marsarchaeota archaeon]
MSNLPEGDSSNIEDVYLADSSSIIDIFRHYDQHTFESLWKDINKLIKEGRFISHMEVFGELSKGKNNPDASWLKQHKQLFHEHTVEQTNIIRGLQKQYKDRFQKVLVAAEKADFHADPWLIALLTELQDASKTQGKQSSLVVSKKKRYLILTEDARMTDFATKELKLNCITKNDLFKKEDWHY